jgi:hypothetical protein
MNMNRTTLPLAALLLTTSLLSCAPTVQGPTGGYRPNVVSGLAYAVSAKIPATDITDQTPATTYATFDDCIQVAISVGDVRKLGAEAADRVCRETADNVGATVGWLAGASAVLTPIVLAIAAFFFVSIPLFFKAILQPSSSGTP